MTTSDMMVDVTNPPITANAMGERREAPSPKPKHMGNMARMVVNVVIMMGRIRCWAACFTASARL